MPTTEQLRQIQANATKAKVGPKTVPKPIGTNLKDVPKRKPYEGVKASEPIKYKNILYVCRACGSQLGFPSGTISVQESDPREKEYGLCKSPKCKWERSSFSDKMFDAETAGIGSFFIRDEELPSVDRFPYDKKIDILRSAFITGPVGTGKTWLLSSIVCDALAAGMRRIYLLSWAWFQLEIRDTYKSSSTKTELDIMEKYINQSILCIDDIGSGKDVQGRESEAARVNLLTLLDKRYANELVTHFSSNLSPDKLASRYDERIASRIQDMCELVVLTENLRKTM